MKLKTRKQNLVPLVHIRLQSHVTVHTEIHSTPMSTVVAAASAPLHAFARSSGRGAHLRHRSRKFFFFPPLLFSHLPHPTHQPPASPKPTSTTITIQRLGREVSGRWWRRGSSGGESLPSLPTNPQELFVDSRSARRSRSGSQLVLQTSQRAGGAANTSQLRQPPAARAYAV